MSLSDFFNSDTYKMLSDVIKASRAMDKVFYLWLYLSDLEIALLNPEELSKDRIEYILEQIEVTKAKLRIAEKEQEELKKELENGKNY